MIFETTMATVEKACRCLSCHAWHVPTCRTPPGEGGVARRKGGVSPPLEREPKAERKGRSAAEVCTSEARKIGEALARREGSALRNVWLPYSRSSERLNFRVGVAGRNGPRGGKRYSNCATGEKFPRPRVAPPERLD
jgi:hypothetical protein